MSETVHQKLLDSEESYLNTTFWDVHPLFLLVQNGETAQLKNQLHVQLEKFPAGRITRDERKQLEYLTVSLVNTFMIAAIQGGVYPPEANAVADQALRRLSQHKSVTEIPTLVSEAALRFSEMVKLTRDRDTGNVHVEKARHYLSDHLTQEIRTEDIAKAVGLSPYHLSRLFKTHTGMTMREYLIRERVEAAKQLLAATDRTIPQIASLLRFCDQSYFTMVFRKHTGQTPGEYRNKNIR
ncbi:MAG: AraC family transcriptional regulator [Oscillospiraceae bacterium]|nr:AraC family transcriptional regulator [Oscillospiraceae bacterium]